MKAGTYECISVPTIGYVVTGYYNNLPIFTNAILYGLGNTYSCDGSSMSGYFDDTFVGPVTFYYVGGYWISVPGNFKKV